MKLLVLQIIFKWIIQIAFRVHNKYGKIGFLVQNAFFLEISISCWMRAEYIKIRNNI